MICLQHANNLLAFLWFRLSNKELKQVTFFSYFLSCFSMLDVNATTGGNAGEAAKSENVSNTTTKSTTNDVEMLMSKMHDLSFMLASNLSVPSKQDEFGSFSKH